VNRLIHEYREVGEALARLDPKRKGAGALHRRYFELPYSDSLRIPVLRADTLAALRQIRRELAAAD
jgi:hypothetical protein